jgi:hypothetical protein
MLANIVELMNSIKIGAKCLRQLTGECMAWSVRRKQRGLRINT